MIIVNNNYITKMAAENSIVVVGSCMIDFVSYAPRLPQEGETIHGTKFVTNFGGKGANQCVAAAKLGGNTTLIARVGDDIWADKYIDNLKACKVNTKYMEKTEGYASGVAQITVSADGANQIVIVAGANSKLCPDDVRRSEQAIKNAAVLVCQLETCAEVAIESMQLCGGVTILNGAPAVSQYDMRLLTTPKIFCVNESEASIFSGVEVKNINDGKEAIEALLLKGCNSVILTLGSEGALYSCKADPNNFVYVKCPKVKCVDSTGAGDSFIGALAYLLANKKDLSMEKCLEQACTVASDSVTKPGTQISFPGPEILLKL
ncbi:PREDICTED: ribokinase-like [Nicrophorus vespilloides]|uniref:Ribokinase n=1 Tax=Nicrophorus vespilloides TaxID=110193 RepID=A0ABM1N769_NICVS|nr:PREDICTED: ribokinase-like [Nicrophorus vespilloides]